jgi:hypothetical protein
MTNNFIVAKLCDNDYGQTLAEGLQEAILDYGLENASEELLKRFLINFTIGKHLCRHTRLNKLELDIEYIKLIDSYLSKELRVSFEKSAPTLDHDGGSAVFDLNLLKSWTY